MNIVGPVLGIHHITYFTLMYSVYLLSFILILRALRDSPLSQTLRGERTLSQTLS